LLEQGLTYGIIYSVGTNFRYGTFHLHLLKFCSIMTTFRY
jgi:hypothetical protein